RPASSFIFEVCSSYPRPLLLSVSVFVELYASHRQFPSSARRNRCSLRRVYPYNRVLAFDLGDGLMPSVSRRIILMAAMVSAFVALCITKSTVAAQEVRGSLVIAVADSSGAAIPAAQVTLTDEESSTHFSQTSDSRGETHFLALTPATYAVEVTARG